MFLNRSHRRLFPVRLRLTLAGWLFLGMAILVGVTAIKSGAPLVYILFGAMMGALMISATLSTRMVAAVNLRRDIATRAWQYQTVYMGYYLRNTRKRGSCLALSLRELSPEGIESVTGYCVHLPPRRLFRAGSRFTPRRRGKIQLRGIELSTSFPFGLVRASRRSDHDDSLVIWPARGRLKKRLLHRGAVETSHAAPSPASGGQDEFFGLREYRPGDNPRWIHWRRTAMLNTPVVREMSKPLPEELWVMIETHRRDLSDVGQATMERMLRFAATLIDHAFAKSYMVGLAMPGSDGHKILPPAPARGHRRALLDTLAEVEVNTSCSLPQAMSRIHRKQLRHAQVVVITPHPQSIPSGTLSSLRGVCRHLTVIDGNKLDNIFADNPFETTNESSR